MNNAIVTIPLSHTGKALNFFQNCLIILFITIFREKKPFYFYALRAIQFKQMEHHLFEHQLTQFCGFRFEIDMIVYKECDFDSSQKVRYIWHSTAIIS